MNKLLTDENIHIIIIDKLREKGYDVATVINTNLTGKSDEIILNKANDEKRILITGDKHYKL